MEHQDQTTEDKKSTTSDLRVLSLTLWSIVNANYVTLFPKAADTVCEIFQKNPQIMPVKKFTNIIMDLKIKAVLDQMAVKSLDYKKVLSLLNDLFPSKGVILPGVSSRQKKMFLERQEITRSRLLELLSNDELREKFLSDFLCYSTCDCHVRAVKEEVKELIDLIEKYLESRCPEEVAKDTKPGCSVVKNEASCTTPRKDNSHTPSNSENQFDQRNKEFKNDIINMDRKSKGNIFKPMTLPLKRKNTEGTVSLRLNKKSRTHKEKATAQENISSSTLCSTVKLNVHDVG